MLISTLKKRISNALPGLSHGGRRGLSSLLGGGRLGKGAPAIGIDLGSRRIKLAVVVAAEQGIVVDRLAELLVPPAMASGGAILDPEGLTEELARLFAEIEVRKPHVTLMVGGNDTFVRRLAMPRMSPQEALRQLPHNQSLRLPIDPANNKLDIFVLDPDGDPNTMQTLIVAARKESILVRQRIAIEAGATLHAVDVDAFALFNVFEHCHSELLRDRATLVEVGYEKSLIVVVDRGSPSVARNAHIGISHLIEHLGTSNLFPDEAERILRSDNPPAIYSDAFRAWSDRLLEEVRRSAGAGRSEAHTGPLYICGGGATIDGLASFLRDRIEGPVSVFDPLATIPTSSNVKLRGHGEGASYALAIGLALRQVL